MSEIGNPTIGDNIEYPYTTTVQTYKGIPFNYRLKKSHYYDIAGSMKGGQILMNGTFQSYSGLDMDYYQGTGSLMTVTVNEGTLPNRSYSQGAFGCLGTYGGGSGAYVNYNKIGNITVDTATGAATGFSASNYLSLPEAFPETMNSCDIIFKGKVTGSGSHSTIIGRSSTTESYICLRHNQYLALYDGSWVTTGATALSGNVYNWYRIIYDGTNFIGYVLADNNYTLATLPDISQWSQQWTTTTNIISGRTFNIGYNFNAGGEYFKGEIDLSGCQIMIDGNIWWSPFVAGLYNVLKGGYVNYTKVGSPTINTETGVVSGFSSSNYLTLGTFSPQGNTWEYYIKFTTGSSTSAQGLSTCVGSSNGCSPFYIDNGNLIAFLSSNGNSWNIASSETIMSISANTTYKMKAEYTGTAYNWYLWQNNAWILVKTISNSTPCYDGLTMLLGNNRGQNNPFGGTIDLSETYITIGGNTWWTPVGGVPAAAVGLLPSGVTDDGSAQTWNLFYEVSATPQYCLDKVSTKVGYFWCGEIVIPAHTV